MTVLLQNQYLKGMHFPLAIPLARLWQMLEMLNLTAQMLREMPTLVHMFGYRLLLYLILLAHVWLTRALSCSSTHYCKGTPTLRSMYWCELIWILC
uniref:Uncharacterized protein n=1 Tax=Brassica campestris TaxID=3711 RepID=A0A3P6CDR9_BRACM|nr:unnamed protein product [Brassica rapa]